MFNERDHYRQMALRRENLLREARREQLVRLAIERKPQTPAAYTALLTRLLLSLFR